MAVIFQTTFSNAFLNENVWISPKFWLKFALKVRINKIPALVRIMAWHRPGGKPLSEPMMVNLLTHVYVLSCMNLVGWSTLWSRCFTWLIFYMLSLDFFYTCIILIPSFISMYIMTLHCIYCTFQSRILACWLMLSVAKTTINKIYLILPYLMSLSLNELNQVLSWFDEILQTSLMPRWILVLRVIQWFKLSVSQLSDMMKPYDRSLLAGASSV